MLIPSGLALFLCSWPLERISASTLYCQHRPPQQKPARTHAHTKARPPVTGFVITCDIACSCYCMFSTHAHTQSYVCIDLCICVDVCACVCVHVGAICPKIQLHINRARTVTPCTLQSAHMRRTQTRSNRGKRENSQ